MTPIVVAIVIVLGALVVGYRLRRSADQTKVKRVAHSTLDAKPLEDLQPQLWISHGNVVLTTRFESFAHLPLAPKPTAYVADISDIAATALIEFNSLRPCDFVSDLTREHDVASAASAVMTGDCAIVAIGHVDGAVFSLREQSSETVTSDSTLVNIDGTSAEVEVPVFIDGRMDAFVRDHAHTTPQGDSTLFHLDDVDDTPATEDASLLIFIDSRMTDHQDRSSDGRGEPLPATLPDQSTLIFVDPTPSSDLSLPIYVGGEIDDENYAPAAANSVLFKIPEPTYDSSIIEIPVYLGGDSDPRDARSAFAHKGRYSQASEDALDAHLRFGGPVGSGNALRFPDRMDDSDEFYALPDSFELPMTTPSDPFAPMPPLPDYMRGALKETAAARPSHPPQLRVVTTPKTESPPPQHLANHDVEQPVVETLDADLKERLREEINDFFSYRREDISEVNVVPFDARAREDTTKEAPAPILDELLTLDATHSQRIFEALLNRREIRALPLHRQDEARAALRRLVALPEVQTFFAGAFRTQIILDAHEGFVYEQERLPVSSSRRLTFFRWLSSLKISHIYLHAMIQLVEETFEPAPEVHPDDQSAVHDLYAAQAQQRW